MLLASELEIFIMFGKHIFLFVSLTFLSSKPVEFYKMLNKNDNLSNLVFYFLFVCMYVSLLFVVSCLASALRASPAVIRLTAHRRLQVY